MSTTTTLDPPSASLGLSLNKDSSPNMRHENFVPRSTSDPTSLTRTPSLLLLPSRSWSESNYNSQISKQLQCPHMHYHQWCEDCQPLMEWEPPQPSRPTCSKQIPSFGSLKKVVETRACYQSPFVTQIKS